MQVTNEFEYLTEMVAHHQEAIDAAAHLARSDRTVMRDFGRAIVETQSAEVARMETWLARWYAGEDTDVDYDPMMRDLSDLAGDELDRIFLQDMILHHMGAVMMSQQLIAGRLAEHTEVRALARSIRKTQHAEIRQMQRWLRTWYDEGWGPGRGWMYSKKDKKDQSHSGMMH